MITTVFLFILFHTVNGFSRWNQSGAREQCKDHGGLISYQDVMGNNKRDGLKHVLYLNDNDSAWISGYTNFSSFIAWFGCFSGNDTKPIEHNKVITKNNIYKCLQYCRFDVDNKFTEIGLRENSCYCLPFLNYQHLQSLADNACNPQLTGPDFFSQNISVYTIVGQAGLSWYAGSPSHFGQCVYVRKVGRRVHYATQPCIRDADGFICVSSVKSDFDGNCYKNNTGTAQYCVITASSNWFHSVSQCMHYSGRLISHFYNKTHKHLSASKTYWTGIVRSYEIISERLPQSACLAVTNVKNDSFIHPDNCSDQKIQICAENVPSTTTSTELTKSENNQSDKETTSTISVNAEKSNETKQLTGIFVAVGIVSAVAISALIFWLVRRRKFKSRRQQSSTENKNHIEEEDYATIDENETKSPNASKMPKSFHSKNETTEQSQPGSRLEHNLDECEYDRVNLKVPGNSDKQCTVNLTEQSADMHVYGHHPGGVDDVTGDYDHLGALNAQQKSKTQDGVYSTMADQTDTYNVLKAEDVANLDTSRDNKLQKEEANTLYDKLSHEH